MIRRFRVRLSIALVAMVLGAMPPAYAASGGVFNGRIVNADGVAVSAGGYGSGVFIANPAIQFNALANSSGLFTSGEITPGAWRITVGSSSGAYLPRTYHLPSGSTAVTLGSAQTLSDTIVLQHMAAAYTDAYRLWGPSRYDTAIDIACETFTNWSGVTDFVLASGSDASAVDALTASGLAGALGCPVLLTGADFLPANVRGAIASAPTGSVHIWIVGGTNAVSSDVVAALNTIGSVNGITRVAGLNRYDTAVAVAGQMRIIAGGPSACLIANGENPGSYYDALALSPLAYNEAWPILLVQKDAVPSATAGYLATYLEPAHKYMAGGTAVISESVRVAVGCHPDDRWWGANRYQTAVSVATHAVGYGWLNNDSLGFAANLPDALAGGAMIGRRGGAMLLTPSTTMDSSVAGYLDDYYDDFDYAYVFGGNAVISESMRLALQSGLN